MRRHPGLAIALGIALTAAWSTAPRCLYAQSPAPSRFDALVSLTETRMKAWSYNTAGFSTGREFPVIFYGPDRVVVTDGPDRGQSMEFIRDDAGRVAWIRVVGRVAVRR